jgi:hypothetical protein
VYTVYTRSVRESILLANLSCRWGLGLDWGLGMSYDLASEQDLHPCLLYSYVYLYAQLNMGHYDYNCLCLEMESCVSPLGVPQAEPTVCDAG